MNQEKTDNIVNRNEENMILAETLLKSAADADRQMLYPEAFDLYQRSLSIWFEILKQETREDKRIVLLELIDHYMKRAEALKKSINDLHASPKSSNQPVSAATGYKLSIPTSSSGTKTTKSSKPIRQLPTNQSKVSKSQQPPEDKSNEYEEQIMSELLDHSPGVRWCDIAGLSFAKQTIQEAVIMPSLRPDLFQGLRSPPKGVLFYGPPGTGKTMLAKAVATESGFKFFNITSSVVTSKYLGEGEKLMKAVFEVARRLQPSVIFFDEIDALLSARKENEHEASRRLKTEFMVQVDGAATTSTDRILIIGATNIPWEIDDAVLRRFVKRIYVPLPDSESREALINNLLLKHQQSSGSRRSTMLPDKAIKKIVRVTEGYSGSDLTALCKEAAMGPIRDIPIARLSSVKVDELRPLSEQDFVAALNHIRPSVSPSCLQQFETWSASFGAVR